jgi:hypothetical protein
LKRTSINDCCIVKATRISFPAGNISIIQPSETFIFEVKRVFWLYDIPAGEARGAHAHKECHQLIIAATGSFEVEVDDSLDNKVFFLNRPFYVLHIPPGIWAHEMNFSAGAICLVLASHLFNEQDYIRDYETYKQYAGTE